MKPFITAILCLLVLATSSASPSKFGPADGWTHKGEFVDVDLKTDKRLWIRYSSIADSGAELYLTQRGKTVWRVYVEPLGVGHSTYSQAIEVLIDEPNKNEFSFRSVASGGTILEFRSLKSGKLLSRRAEKDPKNLLS